MKYISLAVLALLGLSADAKHSVTQDKHVQTMPKMSPEQLFDFLFNNEEDKDDDFEDYFNQQEIKDLTPEEYIKRFGGPEYFDDEAEGSDNDLDYYDVHPEDRPSIFKKPTTRPVKPSIKPVEPTSKPVKPSTKPVVPSTKPVEPTSKPVIPTSKPVKPTTKPVEPTKKPVKLPTYQEYEELMQRKNANKDIKISGYSGSQIRVCKYDAQCVTGFTCEQVTKINTLTVPSSSLPFGICIKKAEVVPEKVTPVEVPVAEEPKQEWIDVLMPDMP